jgi:hypothetical protein
MNKKYTTGDLVVHGHLKDYYGLILETRPSYNNTTEYRILWTSKEDGLHWEDWHYCTCIKPYRKLKWWEK